MLGELTESQIEVFLHSQFVGRIGCYADNRCYVVPVAYAYDGTYLYAHSMQGMKIEMMRINPKICFEIDEISSPGHWRSVIVWGEFEEIEEVEEREKILKFFLDRIEPYLLGAAGSPPDSQAHAPHVVEKAQKPIIFRIKISEKSGRFEKPS